jgi:hypothetical protein
MPSPKCIPAKPIGPGYRAVTVLAVLLIGGLYLWCLSETGEWPAGGYYNMLARAFSEGHLYLPIEPDPALLALPDPWDPSRNEPFRAGDLVLYNRRYYLYQGAAPAVMLFLPWRFIARTDMPERSAVFLFCFLGYVFSAALLARLLASLDIHPPLALFMLLVLALGTCQAVPFLLVRVFMYEVPIACGYFCLSAGFYGFLRGFEPARRSWIWLACSGFMLAAAIGCRPHLGGAVVVAWLVLLVWLARARSFRQALLSREIIAFTLPAAVCILAVAAYNYARFGNPAQFGHYYVMAGASYSRQRLDAQNILPGCYYLLLFPPEFDPVFPFFRLGWHVLKDLPQRYFLEPIAGAFTTWPPALLAIVAPWFLRRRPHPLLWVIHLAAVSSILGISLTGLVSHRFTVDFLPELVLLACVAIALFTVRLRGVVRALVVGASVVLVIYSVAVNLALGVQGPYDQFVQANPAGYVKGARFFSPIPRFRPLLNPRLAIEATFEFAAPTIPNPQPLVTAGRFGSRYALYATSIAGGKLTLLSAAGFNAGNTASAEVSFVPGQPVRVRVDYSPRHLLMTVHWNGAAVIRHRLPFLVTASSQVRIGEDPTGDPPDAFTGRLTVLERRIAPD